MTIIHNTTEMKYAIKQRCDDLALSCTVSCDGAFHASVAVVAEAPGEREVAMGAPLVGGSGQVLWPILGKGGLHRQRVYTTNVVKRRLLEAERKLSVPAEELAQWEAMLRWELAQLPNLKYVLLLGNFALHAVTGESGITMWRGSILPTSIRSVTTHAEAMPTVSSRDVICVATFNPAAVIREPKFEVVFRMDCHKMTRVVAGQWEKHDVTAYYDPSPDEAVQWLDKMQDEGDPVAFDIETISGETACVGFANDNHRGMCINFRTRTENRWTTREELRVRRRMQQLFSDDTVRFVAQNGNFDCYWLWYKDRLRVWRVWFDTMLAHHTLYSQLPHSLAFLTAQYSDHPYYKDEGKTWREGGDIAQFWEYNVKDVCITIHCQRRMLDELTKHQQDQFFFDHVMRLQPTLVRATVGGIRIDQSLKEDVAVSLREDVAKLTHDFLESTRAATHDPAYTLNPDSPQQLARLFFRDLRLIGKGTSTDAINRRRMYDHPTTSTASRVMLNALDKYKTEAKFLSTYAEMKIDSDGRIRCEYKQTGVQSAPGRLSSAKVMWGSGMNLQNQPDRAHQMFTADEGYCFVYFDLSQAEARVVGWLANIETWIEQFEKARIDGEFDCHRALASEMFSIPYEQVPTYDRESDGTVTVRFIAKRCRHGLNYRMAADKLAETTGLPIHTAREAFALYHRINPELREWWQVEENTVRRTRQLVSPLGRVLRIMERVTDEAMESIIAFKPQSTIGDHVGASMYLCEDDDQWPMDARICLNVHDALIALAPISKAATVAAIMRRVAERPIIINGRQLIIPADLKVSLPDRGYHRWSSLRSVRTPDDIAQLLQEAA